MGIKYRREFKQYVEEIKRGFEDREVLSMYESPLFLDLKERIEAVVTQFEQNCITDKHNTVIIYDELTKTSRAYGLEEVKLSKILHSER